MADEKDLKASLPPDASPEAVASGAEVEGDADAAMQAMLDQLPQAAPGGMPEDINFGAASVASAEFQHLQQSAGSVEPRNIDMLMDVDLPVAIELGRAKLSIADILALGPGSVVELNKLAGEPVDLLVNNKVVARGEVVVIDENFGLRITQLMTPEERLRQLANE
jgi:flagellar motor switch protein FliN/FliY